MCGNGIHAGAADIVLGWIDARVAIPHDPEYASSCSGVDFFAAALEMRHPGFRYIHAAEKDKAARSVLRDAWLLADDEIFAEAKSPEAATPPLLSFIASPHPVCNSANGGTAKRPTRLPRAPPRSPACSASYGHAWSSSRTSIRPMALRPSTSPWRANAYDWCEQKLDAHVHAGQPETRERHFWVGIRRE